MYKEFGQGRPADWTRRVFRVWRKELVESDSLVVLGRAFQRMGAENLNAL